MKIAYFVNHYPKVSHSFIRREILALERQGIDVQRIALRGWNDPLPDEEDRLEQGRTRYVLQRGVWALLVPTFRVLLRSPARFFAAVRLAMKMARESARPLPYHLIYLAEACCIQRWVMASGAHRIHAHFGTNSAEVVMLARALGAPRFSFTIHGPDEFQSPWGLEEKVHRSDFVATVSSFSRSQLYLRCRYTDWPKIKIIRCGLEAEFYDITPMPPPAAPRLVCVGRLCEAKGQLLLIEAASRLAAKGIAFELVLAGDGPIRGQLETLIETHGLGKQIRITGWISSNEVRNELLAARALVLPSFAEGLPVVIMEAMALRRPVLSTYIAGIPELVQAGQTGWLFPAGSVNELADAMEHCLNASVDELCRLGDAGHQRVLEKHSIDAEARKLVELFVTQKS